MTIPIVVAPDENHGGAEKNPKKFSIRIDGLAVSPHGTSTLQGPRRVAVLLDLSGSTRSHGSSADLPRICHESNLFYAKRLAAELIRTLAPSDEVTLIEFSAKVEASVGPTTNRQLLISAVESAKSREGWPAMFDAIAGILQQDSPYDAIVVFTDGNDNASKIKDSKLKALLAGSKARIFAFVFMPPPVSTKGSARSGMCDLWDEPSSTEWSGRRLLDSLVNLSGGITFLPWGWGLRMKLKGRDPEESPTPRITASIQLLKDAIDSPMLVDLSWPAGAQPSGKDAPNIELVDENGKKIKNDRVAYPRRMPVCTAPQAGVAAVPANPN